ncbi:MAG: flagellar hook-basal body complex protein FliE [Candidatus Saganbacteria bacterium]|nr:flagellar hook-basal body complex protein FliE [Candidatus Saganbacteria bacterium]
MPRTISPASLRLAQLLGDNKTESPRSIGLSTVAGELKNSPFEDILSKAINSLDAVSKQEIRANQLVGSYLKGEVELSDVMIETSKLSVMVQLAVTTINSAVSTFKEITQMQV